MDLSKLNLSAEEISWISSIVVIASNIVIASVSLYASLSYRKWKKEEIRKRRASIAESCIEHMEQFRLMMSRLIDTPYYDENGWQEFYYETFDAQFAPAAVKAETLGNKEITDRFEVIEQILVELPQAHLDEPKPRRKKKSRTEEDESSGITTSLWKQYLLEWKTLKEILRKEAMVTL